MLLFSRLQFTSHYAIVIEVSVRITKIRISECSYTCEDGLVRLELSTANGKRDVAKFLVFKKQPQVVRKPALGHFELYRVALPRDVDAVRHHAHLQRCEIVVKVFCLWRAVKNVEMKVITQHTKVYTSQNIVSLSSGSSPLASSSRKSLLMNFLKPQSFPWTNLYARWLSARNVRDTHKFPVFRHLHN